ncbi:MAG: CHAT domain-containing protein [Acidobacteria bacterium]|nr:MAG: CHAT domain-containing protein [Acidobacteriota bacterium]
MRRAPVPVAIALAAATLLVGAALGASEGEGNGYRGVWIYRHEPIWRWQDVEEQLAEMHPHHEKRQEEIARSRALLDEVRRARGDASADTARAMELLARSLWNSRASIDEVCSLAHGALAIRRRLFEEGSPRLIPGLLTALDCTTRKEAVGETLELSREVRRIVRTRVRDDTFASQILHSVARALKTCGLYDDSLETLFELERRLLAAGLGASEDLAKTYYEIGKVWLFFLEDAAEARHWYDRAADVVRAGGYEGTRLDALIVNSQAVAAHALGDVRRALDLYRRALRIREKVLGPDHEETGQSWNNIGELLAGLGRLDEARAALERALENWTAVFGPDDQALGYPLTGLAEVALASGDLKRAEEMLVKAEAAYSHSDGANEALHRSEIFGVLALVEAKQGRFDEAVRDAEAAVDLAERYGRPESPTYAEAARVLALVLAARGGIAQSLPWLERSALASRGHLQQVLKLLPETAALRYASEGVPALDQALSLLFRGQTTLEAAPWIGDEVARSRTLLLDSLARRRRAASTADPALAVALDDARRVYAAVLLAGTGRSGEEHARELERARRAYERLAWKAAEIGRALPAPEEITLAEIGRALPAGAVLVAYVRYENPPPDPAEAFAAPGAHGPAAYGALVTRRDAEGQIATAAVPLGPAAEIDPLIDRWRSCVAGARSRLGAGRSCDAAGESLRRRIWDPVAPLARPARLALVVPAGAIALVSLPALPAPEGGFLLEHGPTFHELSAERDLLEGDRRVGNTGSDERLLALGDPDFDAGTEALAAANELLPEIGSPAPVAKVASARPAMRGLRPPVTDLGGLRFTPLPLSRSEAEEIARLFRERTERERAALVLSGARANEAAFRALAPRFRYLHLATHAFVAEPSGALEDDDLTPFLLSGLALAGANRRSQLRASGSLHDGILTAEEIAALDLRGVEWAVLSGCETAAGVLHQGAGIVGLRQAFEIAGARTLVATLWPVRDDAARAFMEELYRRRLDGMAVPDAMRDAALALLRDRREAGLPDAPETWGAFVASGDWR